MQVHFVLERWGIALDAYLDLRTAHGSGQLPRTHVHHIIEGISNGLCYLHNMRVAHCDLKLANILLQTFRRPLPEASASIEGSTWDVHCKVSDLGSTQQVVCLIFCFEIVTNCNGIPRRRPMALFSFIITSFAVVWYAMSLLVRMGVFIRGHAVVGWWCCYCRVMMGLKKRRTVSCDVWFTAATDCTHAAIASTIVGIECGCFCCSPVFVVGMHCVFSKLSLPAFLR